MSFRNFFNLLHSKANVSTYKPSWVSLVRTLGWTAFFLFIAKLFIPEIPIIIPPMIRRATLGTRVTPMLLATEEPGWVRSDVNNFAHDNTPNIAWVTGSSVRIKKKREKSEKGSRWDLSLLPNYTNQLLESNYGIKAKDFLYSTKARRLLDTYTLTLDALSRKPDVLVVILNPFWLYNNQAIFYRENVFYLGAEKWWNKRDWSLQFVLASPSEHLYNMIGKHIPLVMSPTVLKKWLRQKTKRIFGTNVRLPKTLHKQKDVFKLTQPLQFWIHFRDLELMSQLSKNGLSDAQQWQVAAISLSEGNKKTLSSMLIGRLLDTIEESGIPTLVYLAPVSPELLAQPKALVGYQSIQRSMQVLKSRYESDTMPIIIKFPDDILDSLVFLDYLHLKEQGRLPEILVENIIKLLEKK